MNKKMMSAFLAFIGCAVTMTGCAAKDILKNISDSQNDIIVSSSNGYEGEIRAVTGEDIVEAIKNKDKQSIKKMFSQRATELDKNLDSEIDYLISQYEGDFLDYLYNNGSSERGSTHCYADSVCGFQTTESYYKLSWYICTLNTKSPDVMGIHNITLEKCENDDFGGANTSNVAGIVTDKNYLEHEKANELLKLFYQKEYHKNYTDELKSLFADSALSNCDKEFEMFSDAANSFHNLYLHDVWIEEVDNENVVCIKNEDKPCIFICFTLSGDKINYLSMGEIETDEDIQERIANIKGTGIVIS